MSESPRLSPYDLETIRLGHFMALRRIDDGEGSFVGYAVIGQPTPWPRREASIARLVAMEVLEAVPGTLGAIERPLRLTANGERLYESFVRLEESGELRKFMESLEKRNADDTAQENGGRAALA